MRAPVLLVLPLALAALAGCADRELPTAVPAARPSFTEVPGAPVVNSLADDGDGTCTDAGCTLRDALALADPGATITFTVTGTIVLDNERGELDLDRDVSIQGPGADQLTVDRVDPEGTHEFRIFHVTKGTTASISGLTITGGSIYGGTDDGGSGIKNEGTLTVSYSVISGNTGEEVLGGGIFNAAGALTVDHTTVADNHSVDGYGGGIGSVGGRSTITHSIIRDNDATVAGGLFSLYADLTILNSTISGNSGSLEIGGIGGVEGTLATITNSTIAGNSAPEGAGIYSEFTELTILSSTIAGNTADAGSGGGIEVKEGTTHLANTILSGNIGGNCSAGAPIDDGYNLEDGTTCGLSAATSQWPTDPQLDPAGLQDNGGPTPTIALETGSPAIDAIPAGTNGCGDPIHVDQRDVTRPQGAGCDIGAFETTGFDFTGFFAPIGTGLNEVKGGRAVPVKFSLGGDRGLGVFAAGSPVSEPIACELSGATSDVTETVTAGGSSLSYDPTTDQYTYVWKTQKAWAGTCRRLTLQFTDGQQRTADFHFTR